MKSPLSSSKTSPKTTPSLKRYSHNSPVSGRYVSMTLLYVTKRTFPSYLTAFLAQSRRLPLPVSTLSKYSVLTSSTNEKYKSLICSTFSMCIRICKESTKICISRKGIGIHVLSL
uniref:Predicted protein n=1 Tax=Hordeum vulgare subsp. vulgare TaxID=112509 RepID=F2DPE5_HORVV|nr:predicted protein [Hordeum vulgare subsp. vulgare]